MNTTTKGLVLLREISDVLRTFPEVSCAPHLTCDDGHVQLTLDVVLPGADDPTAIPARLRALALYDELRYVADIAQMRALCVRYDIDPDVMEPFLVAARRAEDG